MEKVQEITDQMETGITELFNSERYAAYLSTNAPIAQATSDDRGYAYFEDLSAGRYYLRELENEGYVRDTQKKTVYVKSGETTEVEWENTPITGQIQITKRSADYNHTNGLPAGTLLEGAVFEITDKAGNVVDTIRSNSRGLAVSKQLPLSRYFIREVKAPEHYGISEKELTVYLEYEGQIARLEVEDKSLTTGVSITKTGPKEIMANQPVRFAFSQIANTSNVSLNNFYWRDTLPAQVRLEKVVTGTYNFPGTYKIVYRVNGGDYRTLADNLSTGKSYTLAASSVALGLAANERVTEVMFVFGQAPAGFAQVESPSLYCKAVAGLPAGSFVNVADVGGTYNGTWVQAVSRWVISVYGAGENPVAMKSELMMSICEQQMGVGQLGAFHKSIIDRCTANIYHDFIKSGGEGRIPTLPDWRNEVKRQPEREAQELALASELFVEGSLNMFAHDTNFDIDNRIVCFDLYEMGEQLKPTALNVVLETIQNRVAANRLAGRYTWVFVDEVYLFFKYYYSAQFLYKCWKRFRKYAAAMTAATQNIEECLRSETARLMLANSEFLILLNQAATDRAELAKLLHISETQMSHVTNVEAGHGLMRIGSSIIPFVNEFPRDGTLYRLMTTTPGDK